MLSVMIAPGHRLISPPPSRRTPGKFEATKNGSIWKAIFPRENDDNPLDFGWISVQARASIGCLDMFGLRISATLYPNHKTLAGHASILSNLNFAASFGQRVAKVIKSDTGTCLLWAVLSGFSCGHPMLSTLFHCLHLPGPIE